MGVYTHFGSKQGLLEQLYLRGFRLLEDQLERVPLEGRGRQELLAFAMAYRAFALDTDALYKASRMVGSVLALFLRLGRVRGARVEQP